MTRATIYARVSDDDLREGRSVGEQEQECRGAAAAVGFTVTDVFVDNGVSASRYARKARPGYAALLTHLRAGRADVLVLWESSRGDRELERWAGLLNLCRDRRVRIHVVTHHRTYDLDRPRDWRTLAEDGVDSAYESDKTRDRVRRAVARNAAAGRPHGKLLYGYVRRYDERGRYVEQVADEAQAAVVREAANRVHHGESCRSVATDLNARGIAAPRGGKWDLTQVRRLVTNPAYVGRRVHQGRITGDGAWPALLDETTHHGCVARMNDPRRRSVRDSSVRHLLTGAARCGVCGAPLRVQKNRGFFAYLCSEKFCVSAKTGPIEEYVTAVVLARLGRPDVLALLAHSDPTATEEAASEATEKRARLEGFYEQAAEGRVSPSGLAAIEARLLPEIADAERRARVPDISPVLRDLARPDVKRVWAELPIGTRREVVDLLMTVRVHRTGRGRRKFDPERVEIVWRTERG